ncbi:hypothetical protein [Amycolatopsis methanolica]|uniref:hypothetical protein n=1 Tax=Amycolatopsis methanolica TaxID=1814 RepID=UPI00342881CF
MIWKTTRTPSTVSSWPVVLMSTVGRIKVTVPVEVVIPSPAPSCPTALTGNAAPYMYAARRDIAGPASTISLTACSRKPSVAITGTPP